MSAVFSFSSSFYFISPPPCLQIDALRHCILILIYGIMANYIAVSDIASTISLSVLSTGSFICPDGDQQTANNILDSVCTRSSGNKILSTWYLFTFLTQVRIITKFRLTRRQGVTYAIRFHFISFVN